MAKPEEFEIEIGPDGKIRLDFRGMEVESYRRIVEMLRDTVGPIEALDVSDPEEPPTPQRLSERERTREDEELKQHGDA